MTEFRLGREGPGYLLQPHWILLTSPLSAEEEALVSEGLEKRLKGCKRAAKLGLMCWPPPNSQGRRPRPAAVGGGPRGSHTTSNALQLSPLLSLCWFGENKNQI